MRKDPEIVLVFVISLIVLVFAINLMGNVSLLFLDDTDLNSDLKIIIFFILL